jgi:hypothetical protein
LAFSPLNLAALSRLAHLAKSARVCIVCEMIGTAYLLEAQIERVAVEPPGSSAKRF